MKPPGAMQKWEKKVKGRDVKIDDSAAKLFAVRNVETYCKYPLSLSNQKTKIFK